MNKYWKEALTTAVIAVGVVALAIGLGKAVLWATPHLADWWRG